MRIQTITDLWRLRFGRRNLHANEIGAIAGLVAFGVIIVLIGVWYTYVELNYGQTPTGGLFVLVIGAIPTIVGLLADGGLGISLGPRRISPEKTITSRMDSAVREYGRGEYWRSFDSASSALRDAQDLEAKKGSSFARQSVAQVSGFLETPGFKERVRAQLGEIANGHLDIGEWYEYGSAITVAQYIGFDPILVEKIVRLKADKERADDERMRAWKAESRMTSRSYSPDRSDRGESRGIRGPEYHNVFGRMMNDKEFDRFTNSWGDTTFERNMERRFQKKD